MSTSPHGVEASGLCRRYGRRWALVDVSLRVPAGRVAMVTGRNGSGKSTLLRILSTAIRADRGSARVAGFDVGRETDAVRRRDLRVSEMLKLRGERFLILERTDQVTVLFEVDLATGTNILGSSFDNIGIATSLEQTVLPSSGVTPLAKTQRLIASSLQSAQPRFPAKLEGLARARDGRLMIVNDDDFGITDARTQVNLVDGLSLGSD